MKLKKSKRNCKVARFYSRYTYKINIKIEWLRDYYYEKMDEDFKKSARKLKRCINANRQIVGILQKYNYKKYTGTALDKVLTKAIGKKFIQGELMELYEMITGGKIKRESIPVSPKKITHDEVISEKDLVILANLFRIIRLHFSHINSLLQYLPKNSKLYRKITYTQGKSGFDALRSTLDDINCFSDDVSKKYGVLFYDKKLTEKIVFIKEVKTSKNQKKSKPNPNKKDNKPLYLG